MKIKISLNEILFLIIVFVAGLMAQDVASAEGLTISDVSISQPIFRPSQGERVDINYTISEATKITIKIFDVDDYLIRDLIVNVDREAGENSQSWDGRDMEEKVVPDEAYYFTIEARTEAGGFAVYDPKTFSGGEEVTIPYKELDRQNNQVIYRLPKTSRVSIRAGIHSGPLLKTILDWKPRIAGINKESWDFKDESAVMDISQRKGFDVIFNAYALPENSIIVRETKLSYPEYKRQLAGRQIMSNSPVAFEKKAVYSMEKGEEEREMARIEPRPKKVARPRLKTDAQINPHYQISPLVDQAVQFSLNLPGVDRKTPAGIPIVRADFSVQVTLDEESKQLLEEKRYEIIAFIDDKFIIEEEQSYSPYNLFISTEDLTAGLHTIVINVATLTDQIGSQSLQIWVEE